LRAAFHSQEREEGKGRGACPPTIPITPPAISKNVQAGTGVELLVGGFFFFGVFAEVAGGKRGGRGEKRTREFRIRLALDRQPAGGRKGGRGGGGRNRRSSIPGSLRRVWEEGRGKGELSSFVLLTAAFVARGCPEERKRKKKRGGKGEESRPEPRSARHSPYFTC